MVMPSQRIGETDADYAKRMRKRNNWNAPEANTKLFTDEQVQAIINSLLANKQDALGLMGEVVRQEIIAQLRENVREQIAEALKAELKRKNENAET